MPDLTAIVSGSDTGVGKTWVTARLIESLRTRKVQVTARKPVQSFDPTDERPDAEVLAAACGVPADLVCPPHRSLPLAMAPPIAADRLGLPTIRIEDLVRELRLPQRGVALVEGVGGPRSPLAHDGDTVRLAHATDPRLVILVAPAGLGALNGQLLGRDAYAPLAVVAFLNRYDANDPVHETNERWLSERCGMQVATSIDALADVVTALLPVEVG